MLCILASLVISIILLMIIDRRIHPDYLVESINIDTGVPYSDSIIIDRFYIYEDFGRNLKAEKSDMYFTDAFYEDIPGKNKMLVISSKQELTDTLEKYIRFMGPNFTDKLPEDFFNNNRLGLVFITFTGLAFPGNHQIKNSNGTAEFSVEIRDRKAEAIPALANYALYILIIPV